MPSPTRPIRRQIPPGTVSIIDVHARTVIATAGFAGVPQFGNNLRTNPGMDFEPEHIAVDHDGHRAIVTLQDANGIAELDLNLGAFIPVTGLGAKDFNIPDMPDAIATYKWRGGTYLVMANEGDFREDAVDRSGASAFGGVNPLDRLRVSNRDSSIGNLFAAGARSFSIRDQNGELIFDSGNVLDTEAHIRGVYDDGRSRDKGVEPEGVGLPEIRGGTYAFIGLERTTRSAIAIFDITSPFDVSFVDMIVTTGDLSPEGLAALSACRSVLPGCRQRGTGARRHANEHDAVPAESVTRRHEQRR
jgi:hypothetical protein